jgi:hypothetical protein
VHGLSGFSNYKQREERAASLGIVQSSAKDRLYKKGLRYDAEMLPKILEAQHLQHYLPQYKMVTSKSTDFKGTIAKGAQYSNSLQLLKRRKMNNVNQN